MPGGKTARERQAGKSAAGKSAPGAASVDPQLLVCPTPGDLASARAARAFIGRQGAVVVDPLSATNYGVGTGDLGAAVLRGIGKSEHLNALKRKADPLALAWLCAHELGPDGQRPLMVVCEAHQLREEGLATLRSWSGVAGIDLCLLVPDYAPCDALIEYETAGWDSLDWADLCATLAARPIRPANRSTTTPRWRLPRVDGLIFRSTCRDVLAASDFAEVDALFVDKVLSFRRSFESCGNLADTARYATIVRAAIEQAPSTEELVVSVRAAQVAALAFGLVLTVDTVRLLAAAESLCRRGLAGPQRWWEELDRYQDPDPGALAALYQAELNLADAVQLRLSDLHVGAGARGPAGGQAVEVDLGDRQVVIEPPAARFLVVQRQYRLLCGAAPDDPLFATFRGAGMTTECAVNQLRLATAELGVDIITGVLSTWHHNTPAYLARYGLRLHKALKAPNSPRDPQRPIRRRKHKP